METITQRSRHSRRVSMTCYLINKTASVLRPKFSRGCAECLPDTGDAAAINKRIIVRNTPGIGKQKQLHAARQTSTHCTNGGMRMLAADTPTNDARDGCRVSSQTTFNSHFWFTTFFLPPSPPIFTTLQILFGGFTPMTQIKFRWKFAAFSAPRELNHKKKYGEKYIYVNIS